jgi:curved DNA-binding protein CbpA
LLALATLSLVASTSEERTVAREQYEIRWKDYHQTLWVDPTADADAYRSLARSYHPDRNPSPDATEKFQEINEAKEVLADPNRRAAYDQVYWARRQGEYFEEPSGDAWDPYDYQDYQWEEDFPGKVPALITPGAMVRKARRATATAGASATGGTVTAVTEECTAAVAGTPAPGGRQVPGRPSLMSHRSLRGSTSGRKGAPPFR